MKSHHIIKNSLTITAIATLCLLAFVLQSPFTAHAANDKYTLLEPLPCIAGGSVTCTTNGATTSSLSISTYLQYAFNLLIALAAVAAVFMIVWGGFEYMTTESWTGKGDGIKKVTNAIWGLLMILCTYLILRTINPSLVNIPASLVPSISSSGSTSGSSAASSGITTSTGTGNGSSAGTGTTGTTGNGTTGVQSTQPSTKYDTSVTVQETDANGTPIYRDASGNIINYNSHIE